MAEDYCVPVEETSWPGREQHSRSLPFRPRIGDPGRRLPILSCVQVGGWQLADGPGLPGGGEELLLLLLHHSQEIELIRTPRSGHEGAMDTIPALWQPVAR